MLRSQYSSIDHCQESMDHHYFVSALFHSYYFFKIMASSTAKKFTSKSKAKGSPTAKKRAPKASGPKQAKASAQNGGCRVSTIVLWILGGDCTDSTKLKGLSSGTPTFEDAPPTNYDSVQDKRQKRFGGTSSNSHVDLFTFWC